MDNGMRVELIAEVKGLALGARGTALFLNAGSLPEEGMVRVKWDSGQNLPMYIGEIREVIGD